MVLRVSNSIGIVIVINRISNIWSTIIPIWSRLLVRTLERICCCSLLTPLLLLFRTNLLQKGITVFWNYSFSETMNYFACSFLNTNINTPKETMNLIVHRILLFISTWPNKSRWVSSPWSVEIFTSPSDAHKSPPSTKKWLPPTKSQPSSALATSDHDRSTIGASPSPPPSTSSKVTTKTKLSGNLLMKK